MEEPIRYSPILSGSLKDLIHSVKAQKLEGLIAKRCDSKYEPGQRSGAWMKMRVNQDQELVIGGYTPSLKNFDALVVGYYDGPKPIYAARTRNGFTPASRYELFKKIKPLGIAECPFANLPEKKAGRWGAGLTAAKMEECRWLRPQLVAQFEFVEWTEDGHLRHNRFVALRDDKRPEGRAAGGEQIAIECPFIRLLHSNSPSAKYFADYWPAHFPRLRYIRLTISWATGCTAFECVAPDNSLDSAAIGKLGGAEWSALSASRPGGQLLGYERIRSLTIAVVVRVRRLSLIVQEETRALRGANSLVRTRRAAEVVECCQVVRRAAVGKIERTFLNTEIVLYKTQDAPEVVPRVVDVAR
jgi:hypothetical protein